MTSLDWLIARPIAHRGLHDAAHGVMENTASAVTAAIEAGFAIEVDLQRSADGEAMVFHDATLDRLTQARGLLRNYSAEALGQVALAGTSDRMMRLDELLVLVGGRTPLVLELKSQWDGDTRLARRTAAVLGGYAGPVAVMSFDPAPVAAMARMLPSAARGLVVQRPAQASHGSGQTHHTKLAGLILHMVRSRPHFVACRLQDLASGPAFAARYLLGLPLLAWTVRSAEDYRLARRRADQVIFEGFNPLVNDNSETTRQRNDSQRSAHPCSCLDLGYPG